MDEQRKQPAGSHERDIANKSGIPLQHWVAETVEGHAFERGKQGRGDSWRVEDRELPSNGEFIDVLLRYKTKQAASFDLLAVLEVKRWIDKNQPVVMVFHDTARPGWNEHCNATLTYLHKRSNQPMKPGVPAFRVGAMKCEFTPSSRFAQYCTTSPERENLDSICGNLLGQCEGLAAIDASGMKHCFVIPILVTTAELRVLHLGPVDLATGMLQSSEPAVSVPWIRYTKTLSQGGLVPHEPSTCSTISDWTEERKRTVFVVTATRLVDFLDAIEFHPPKA